MSSKRAFTTTTWVFMPVAIALNIVIGQVVLALKLPVFLDSIGTILVAVLAGPWAAALTGGLTNIIWGLAVDPNALPWWPVAVAIGLVAGFCARAGLFKKPLTVVLAGLLVAVTAALASTPIAVYLYGGITASGSSFLTAYLMQTGVDMVKAVFSTNFIVEPVDKITTVLLAFLILQGVPKRLLAQFPYPENLDSSGTQKPAQALVIAAVILVVVIVLGFTLIKLFAGA